MNIGLGLNTGMPSRPSRIDRIEPTSGNPLGGLVVTVYGAGFLGSQVSVNGSLVIPLSIPNDGQMTLLMLPLTLGPKTIRVLADIGDSNDAIFTVTL